MNALTPVNALDLPGPVVRAHPCSLQEHIPGLHLLQAAGAPTSALAKGPGQNDVGAVGGGGAGGDRRLSQTRVRGGWREGCAFEACTGKENEMCCPRFSLAFSRSDFYNKASPANLLKFLNSSQD